MERARGKKGTLRRARKRGKQRSAIIFWSPFRGKYLISRITLFLSLFLSQARARARASSRRAFNSFSSRSSSSSSSFYHRWSHAASLSPCLCRGIGSQSSVYVGSYEIPRRTVSAVIEYFYTAEFNSGPRWGRVNGGGGVLAASRGWKVRHAVINSAARSVAFIRTMAVARPLENQHGENSRRRIMEYNE